MVFQGIYRVIGRTDHFDVTFLQKSLRPEVLSLQHLGASLVDFPRRLRLQYRIDAKDTAQLKVRPVVKGIAHGIGNGSRPCLELLVIGFRARDIFLGDAIPPHGTPLVMVAPEPNLRQVTELMVLCNHLRVEMAVVIKDRQRLRTSVV